VDDREHAGVVEKAGNTTRIEGDGAEGGDERQVRDADIEQRQRPRRQV
jgi:hypothetical protein